MREHIEFIQAQRLPWEDAHASGFAGGHIKMLSDDPEDGSFSSVLKLPAGWSRPSAVVPFDEEFYILDGDLQIAGVTYSDNAYCFIAAGGGSNALKAPHEVVLLYFRSGKLADNLRTPAAAAQRSVEKIDLGSADWDGDFEKLGLGPLSFGARMKVLREDPFSGETTYISASIAYRIGKRAERHPIVQEFFMLSGELAGELGVMQAGAYCFRPPMFKHGPYGSPTGAVILFRGLGGKHETFWEDGPPFSFHPDHTPILPERLKPLGNPLPRPSRY
jgi:ChrR Cupin-like domain